MYKSQSLLTAHGRLEISVELRMKNSNAPFIECGSSQSVNVKRHINQMIEEAVINALYKLNHRRGERIFNKDNYNDDIATYLNSYKIRQYKIEYYEDRRYSYKRERRKILNNKTGLLESKYRYVTYRDNVEYQIEEPEYLTPKTRKEKQTSTFKQTSFYHYKKKDKQTNISEL